MSLGKQIALRAAMTVAYRAHAHELLSRLTRGRGAILMLHSVSPEPARAFDPNAGLRVTPDFLDQTLSLIRGEGYDIVSIEEVLGRLTGAARGRPFVAVTLDDGYRDNLRYALPIFQSHQAPFCVYVPTAFPCGSADLWWYALEGAISAATTLRVTMEGKRRTFPSANTAEKQRAWQTLYWWLRGLDEDRARSIVADLCKQAGFDTRTLPGSLLMSAEELLRIAADPLCTIGAHTVNHYALAKLDDDRCRREIVRSKLDLEAHLGRPVRHFSYPYGSKATAGPREFAMAAEAGFVTAVTTRKGMLFSAHAEHPMALPRLSLNGQLQDERLVKVLLSGAPFALLNGFRQVSVA